MSLKFSAAFTFLMLGSAHLLAGECDPLLVKASHLIAVQTKSPGETSSTLSTATYQKFDGDQFIRNNPITQFLTQTGFESDSENPLIWRRASDHTTIIISTEGERADQVHQDITNTATKGEMSHVFHPDGTVEAVLTVYTFPWEEIRMAERQKKMPVSYTEKLNQEIRENSLRTLRHELVHADQRKTPYGLYKLEALKNYERLEIESKKPNVSPETKAEFYAASREVSSLKFHAARWISEIEAHSVNDPVMYEIWNELTNSQTSDEEIVELLRRSAAILESRYYYINMGHVATQEAILWIKSRGFLSLSSSNPSNQ